MAGDPTKCGVVGDLGTSITGKAAEVISGGQFVKLMSGTGITSGLTDVSNNYVDKILVYMANATADAEFACGMATNNAASGSNVTIALDGIVLATAGGNIAAAGVGKSVKVSTGTDPTAVQSDSTGVSGVGYALTSAASGEYVLVKLGNCK